MKRWQAIRIILEKKTNSLFVHANGMISREAFAHQDLDTSFYMLGSMGQACPIALGVAMCTPERQVVVLDGDGNLLSNLGALAMVGKLQPANLLHVVLDNGVYDSTGGQRSIADDVSLCKIATAAGFNNVWSVSNPRQLEHFYSTALLVNGPSFLHVKVEVGALEGIERVKIPPEQIAERFKSAIESPEKTRVTVVGNNGHRVPTNIYQQKDAFIKD